MAADLQVAFVRDTSARDRGVTSTGVGPRCDVWGSRMGIERVGTSDVEAVRRVLGGDTDAYATLVARYRDRLARYAVHMLGNREDAEEALQDAFVRAYRSLERCDDAARFGAWLYGILVNRCRTTGARAAKRGRVFVRDEAALNGVAHDRAAERPEGGGPVRAAVPSATGESRGAV